MNSGTMNYESNAKMFIEKGRVCAFMKGIFIVMKYIRITYNSLTIYAQFSTIMLIRTPFCLVGLYIYC